MGTASILLPVAAATVPDGSTSNAAPAVKMVKGSEAAPAKFAVIADFDASTEEMLWWSFRLPGIAATSPAPVVILQWSSIAAITSTNVVWSARIGAVTPADADTPLEHASAAATTVTSANDTTEAGRLISASVTLANVDSIAAADLVFLRVARVAGDASDTLAEDARLWTVTFEFTTS